MSVIKGENSSILLSFILAYGLTLIPLTWELALWMPHWVFITSMFWAIYFPLKHGIGWAWFAGLWLDVVVGYPLGVNAFAMAVSVALAIFIAPRFRVYSVWLQTWMVFVLTAACALLTFWAKNIYSMPTSGLDSLLSALTSALVWPLIYAYLRVVARIFHLI
jgi:rod shape-determining protein MreD